MRNRVRAVLSGFVVSCEAKNTKQGATGRAQGILASATMGVSAMFTGFTKRYSAKYIQTGRFVGIVASTMKLYFCAVSSLFTSITTVLIVVCLVIRRRTDDWCWHGGPIATCALVS